MPHTRRKPRVTAHEVATTPPAPRKPVMTYAERAWFINRLEEIKRHPDATETDIQIASDMLAHYREV